MSELKDLRAQIAAVRTLADAWKCRDDTCDGDCTGCSYSTELRDSLVREVGPKCSCGWRLSPPGLADRRIVNRTCPFHGPAPVADPSGTGETR